MNKLTIFALLFSLLQLTFAMNLRCDKSDMTTCKKAMAEMLDRGIQDAHLTMSTKMMRHYIDMCRELKNRCDNDKTPNCKETMDKAIGDLKTDMEVLDEKKCDRKQQLEVVKKMINDLKSNKLDGLAGAEQMKNIAAERHMEEIVNASLRDFMDEVLWHMREAMMEMKKEDIMMEEIEKSMAKMEDEEESTDNTATKMHEMTAILTEMGDAMAMTWAKELKQMM